MQQPDGTISLQLDKADRYSDIRILRKLLPSGMLFFKTGRYNVWLSSATKDTTDLNYKSKVLVSVQDTRMKVFLNVTK